MFIGVVQVLQHHPRFAGSGSREQVERVSGVIRSRKSLDHALYAKAPDDDLLQPAETVL
jgi:hypothetical protein